MVHRGLFSLNPTVRIGMDVRETVGMAKRGLRLVKWIDDAPSLVECILNKFTDYSFFFLPRGRVDPGLICSILTRARSIFLMMPSTVAVQMKGFGCSFQLRINSSIACFKSGTLTKLARLIALSLNSLNQRSTKFSQLELVGMKWLTNRGCFFSHACTCGSLCVP